MTEQTPQSQLSSTSKNGKPLLKVNNLKMYFPIVKGIFGRIGGYVKAADEVSFSIQPGETLGLVGESGCGKTTVGRCLVRAYKPTFVEKRPGSNNFYGRISYTYCKAMGTGSFPLQNYYSSIQNPYSYQGLQQYPLAWDQRHKISFNISYLNPKKIEINLLRKSL